MLRNIAYLVVFAVAVAAGTLPVPRASATETPAYRGLWVATDYPSQTVAPGKPASIDIQVHNAGLPPEVVDISIAHAPKDWKAELLGAGHPVRSVFVGPDGTARLTLKLTPPKGVKSGSHDILLTAKGADGQFQLPLRIAVGDVAPAGLKLESDLPELRGSASSKFEYKLALTNSGGKDLTVRLDAAAPAGFQASFSERYGSQELTSIPLKAGEKKDLTFKVQPPRRIDAAIYKVEAHADADGTGAATMVALDITGRPDLSLTGADERLSGEAKAGDESALDLVVANAGSAAAKDVKLTATEPSGWKVRFEPDEIASIAPGEEQKVKALVTPSAEAIAGDYQVSMRASGGDGFASSNFRVTVRTSTLWGMAGILTIAASLGVLGMAIVRYGRR